MGMVLAGAWLACITGPRPSRFGYVYNSATPERTTYSNQHLHANSDLLAKHIGASQGHRFATSRV